MQPVDSTILIERVVQIGGAGDKGPRLQTIRDLAKELGPETGVLPWLYACTVGLEGRGACSAAQI
jgi:hypothetical protein